MIKKIKNITYHNPYVNTEQIPIQIMTLGALIKYMRLSRGYTQKQTADSLGTVRQHIQKWERGKIKPCPRNMQQIMLLFQYVSYNDVVRRYYV